jgi:hypothetical protein
VESAERNHSGSLKKFPIAKPIIKLKITASKLMDFIAEFPARSNAIKVKRYKIGKVSKKYLTDFPIKKAPNVPIEIRYKN